MGLSESPVLSGAEIKELAPSLARRLHEEWRLGRMQEDGALKSKLEKVKDANWVARTGKDEVDLANTRYENLPEEWKVENKKAADGVMRIIAEEIDRGCELADLLIPEKLEALAIKIHEEWSTRNEAESSNAPLLVLYEQLSEEEKEKDRRLIRLGVEVCEESGYF